MAIQVGTAIVVGAQVELTRVALALVSKPFVLVLVVTEVLCGETCLVLTIRPRTSPSELER